MLTKNKSIALLDSIQQVADRYNTYLVDVGGVVYDGTKSMEAGVTCINNLLKDPDNSIIFLSNNPRPSTFTKQILDRIGIVGKYRIVTSGDVLNYTIAHSLRNKKIYHLGRNRQHTLLDQTRSNLTNSIQEADAIIISCFVEGTENHEQFDKELQEISRLNKPIYCPNPDQLALEGSLLRYPSGYFAQKIISYGGSVIFLGKPDTIIYDFISIMYPHSTLDRATTIMIGDTMETDICGAHKFGIDSLLILQGISGLLLEKNPTLLQQYPYQPTYIMDYLQ